jgi:polar amino acid transport system substrate-binding protein
MNKIIAVVLTFTLSVFFVGCSEKEKDTKIKENKVLRVGMELAYPPFEMSDKQGNPSGVSVDFAKGLASYLGQEIQIENIAWDGLIPSLKTGKIDLIISSMTITDERKKSIDFSIPYAQSSLAILANKSSNIKSIDDLNVEGKKVAVKKGSTGHIYARDYLKNAEILVFDKESNSVLEVVQGKVDGFIYDQLTIYKNYSKNKTTTEPLLKSFQKDFEYWGVALRQNDPLKEKVNAYIKKAKENGTFAIFANTHLSEAKKTFDELNIPFFF